jgi:hypothetical protein
MIKKHIKDKKILKLIYDFITPFGEGVSLGLGSQVSQIAAIFYANIIDHIIKETYGIKHYGRYMDDLFLISNNKSELLNILENIIQECKRLRIKINTKKTRITKIQNGMLYLKGIYKLNTTGKVIKIATSESKKRMRKKLSKFYKLLIANKIRLPDIYNSYQSWRGNYRKRFNSFHTIKRMDSLYDRLFIYNHLEEKYG